MAKTNQTKTATSSKGKRKPGRKNKTGIAFPNTNRSYDSLNHQEKKKFLTYQKEYVRAHYRTFLIRMNLEEDAEIIAWLEQQDNKSDYIRTCVEDAMNRAQRKTTRKKSK